MKFTFFVGKSYQAAVTIVLAAILLVAAMACAHAQVGVYRMSFKETGSSLNYDFYTGGYFVCELPEGTGTFIFTTEENTQKLYTTSAGAGELFIVKDGDIRMAGIGATGDVGNADSALLVTGSKFDKTNIGGGMRMPVVKKLSGTFLAFIVEGTRGDGGGSTGTSGLSQSSGLAGFAKASFTLDSALTRDANADLLSVSETVNLVTARLERNGYQPENDQDENGGTDGSDGTTGGNATLTTGS